MLLWKNRVCLCHLWSQHKLQHWRGRSRIKPVRTEKKQKVSLTSCTNAGEMIHINYHTKSSKEPQTSVCFPGCTFMMFGTTDCPKLRAHIKKMLWRPASHGHTMFHFCLLWAHHSQPGSLSISHRQWVSGRPKSTPRMPLTTTGAMFHAVTAVYTKFETAPFTLLLPGLYGNAFWGKLGLMGASGIVFSTPFLVELPSSGSCVQRSRETLFQPGTL